VEDFVKGDIVILNFPFSDLSATKRRPAFVLANLGDDDVVLCQITSHIRQDKIDKAVQTAVSMN
jgi:mRNA interferase MazF